MMRDSQRARRGKVRRVGPIDGDDGLMPERTYSRESGTDVTKATAHLPGLDVEILHQQSPDGDWEQVSINLRATPSFDAVGRLFELADPFTLWMRAARLMWMPWLLMAPTAMTLPESRSRTLPSLVSPQQKPPAAGD